MKKFLSVLMVFMLVTMCYVTVVKASANDKLIDYATKGVTISGKVYKLSSSDTLKLKRILTDNPITDSQADQIIAKANQIANVMRQEGVSDPNQLSKAKKQQILSLAQEAASIANVNLTYDSSNKNLVLSKNGVTLDAISVENTKLVQTGENNIVYICGACVAVIAVATISVIKVRKSTVNA